MEQIKIRQPILDILLTHTQFAYPKEACGLLAGSKDCIHHLYLIENILQSPVAYEMNAQQQIEAMLHAEEQGLELLAVYHSHPLGPSKPSATDIAQAYYPELCQLIISLSDRQQPIARAFTIGENKVEEINLVIE